MPFTYSTETCSPPRLSPRSKTGNMFDSRQQSNNHSRVKSLQLCPQFVGRELFFLCKVQVKISCYRVRRCFHMVHLLPMMLDEVTHTLGRVHLRASYLVESPNQDPELLVGETSDQRLCNVLLLFVPSQIRRLGTSMVQLEHSIGAMVVFIC